MKIYFSKIKGNKNFNRQKMAILYHHPIEATEGIHLLQNNSELPSRKTQSTATGLCQYWQSSSVFHWYSLLQTPCLLHYNRDTTLLSGETCLQVKLQWPAFWNSVYSSHYQQVNHLKEKVKLACKWFSSNCQHKKKIYTICMLPLVILPLSLTKQLRLRLYTKMGQFSYGFHG